MSPDDDHADGEIHYSIDGTTVNSGVWGNSLAYQILLDIQQVSLSFNLALIIIHIHIHG